MSGAFRGGRGRPAWRSLPAAFLAAVLLAGRAAAAPWADEAAVAATREALEELFVRGSRLPGLPANLALEARVRELFAASGFTNGVLEFTAPAFLPGDTRLHLEDGRSFVLHPLHPALFRPGNFAEPGFACRVVDLRRCLPEDLAALRGVELRDALALLDFHTGRRWEGLLRFGVRGFLFAGAEEGHGRRDAFDKVPLSEVSVPRFLVAPADAAVLRAAMGAGRVLAARVTAAPSRWENRVLGDPWVLVPGADPALAAEVVAIVAPLDANGVAPGLAEGAEAGANLHLLLTLLADFRRAPPARSVLLAAVNARTQNYLGDRVLAWYLLAPEAGIEEVRNTLAESLRLQELIAGHMRRLRFTPGSRREDEAFLEELRTLADNSLGREITIKDPLVALCKRDVNALKIRLLARRREAQELQARVAAPAEAEAEAELAAARERLATALEECDGMEAELAARVNVLTLFNRAGVRTTLGDLDERSTEMLREYVGEVRRRHECWAALNRADLERSERNGAIRERLGGRKVSLVLSLEQVWTGDGVAFASGVDTRAVPWADRWGRNTVRLAAGLPEVAAGRRASLLTDSLTQLGGLAEPFYVPCRSDALLVYHRAGRTPALALVTPFVHGGRGFTPDDTFDRLDVARVAEAGAFLRAFLPAVLADTLITSEAELPAPPVGREELWSTVVNAFKFDDFAAGVAPEIPVPRSVVILTSPWAPRSGFTGDGVSGAYFALTDERASALFYGLRENKLCSGAFAFDDDFRRVTHVVDAGETHAKIGSDITPAPRRTISLVECGEFVVGDRADSSLLRAAPLLVQRYYPLSARRNSEPRRYGISGAASAFSTKAMPNNGWGPAGFYFPRDERIKIITAAKRLALNAAEEAPEGTGFSLAQGGLPDFFAQAQADMNILNRHRLRKFRHVGDALADDFLERSRQAEERRAAAEREGDHLGRARAVVESLGAQVKAYERITSITNDMLKAVVFYMALLLPFCFFIQKLLFRTVRIEAQMGIFAGLFVLCYVVFRLVHPAFRLAQAPEAMFIAFVMGGLGLFVIWILHGRFEGEMRLLFHTLTGAEEDVAGYAMVGQQAMLIGVNNMKRRRIRTALTTATIVLVTFTMLAFTSVSKRLSPTLIAQDRAPSYTGLMYHWPGGRCMDEDSAAVLRQMFAGEGTVLTRRWLLPGDIGQPGGALRVVAGEGRTALIDAVLGLETAEEGFLGRLPVVHGRFFSADDAAEALISVRLAEVLGISPGQVGEAEIAFLDRRWRVAGLLDDAGLRMLEDLNGMSVLPIKQLVRPTGQETGDPLTDAEALADESGVFYAEPAALIVLPAESARRLGAAPYSVSVRLPPGRPVWPAVDRLLTATAARCFMASREPFSLGGDGRRRNAPGVYYVGGGYRTAIGGLAVLIVPLLIAATIIFNTMLGSVFERRREIEVFNAIGLNPTHIGLFFLAESFVYGIVGAVGGYLIGQLLSILLNRLGWLTDANLNFSSLSVAYVIVFTIAVVLLSTLYPAMVATKAAVPSGKRTWSMPPHDGQRMAVVFPFVYQPALVPGVMRYLADYFAQHTEASTGDLIATPRGGAVGQDAAGRPVYRLAYHGALAPFDLGVTQSIVFEGAHDERVEAYRLTLRIVRESGQDANWVATNKPFLEHLRKLLLHWRNLEPAEHDVYVRRGRSLFDSGEDHGLEA